MRPYHGPVRGRTLAGVLDASVEQEERTMTLKRIFGSALLAVIALGTLVVAMPVPTTNACLYCVPIDCPPCYALSGGSCFRCPSCKKIPGCKS